MPTAFFKNVTLAAQIVILLPQPAHLTLLGRFDSERPWLALRYAGTSLRRPAV